MQCFACKCRAGKGRVSAPNTCPRVLPLYCHGFGKREALRFAKSAVFAKKRRFCPFFRI